MILSDSLGTGPTGGLFENIFVLLGPRSVEGFAKAARP